MRSFFFFQAEDGIRDEPDRGAGHDEGGFLHAHIVNRHDRPQHRQGPPPRLGRKRGTQSKAIGRSRGVITIPFQSSARAIGDLTIKVPRAQALAQQIATVHLRLDAASAVTLAISGSGGVWSSSSGGMGASPMSLVVNSAARISSVFSW